MVFLLMKIRYNQILISLLKHFWKRQRSSVFFYSVFLQFTDPQFVYYKLPQNYIVVIWP